MSVEEEEVDFTAIETRCRIDRTYGISRDVGQAWFNAVRYGDLGTTRTLLKKFPKLVHYNGKATSYGFIGSIAMHWACANGDKPLATLLVSKGSSINAQNNGGSTPLHSACSNGQPEMAMLLLSHGAIPSIIDCCGDTALDVARGDTAHMLRPLLSGYSVMESLSRQSPEQWSVGDMKKALALVGKKDAQQALEKSELVSAVKQVVEHFKKTADETASKDDAVAQLHAEVEARDLGRKAEEGLSTSEKMQANKAKENGNNAFRDGDFKKAIRMYTVAINVDPTDAVFYSNRSACYLNLQQPVKALADAKQCVELKRDWAKGYHRLGSANLALGRFADAERAFQRGLMLAPGDESLTTALEQTMARAVEAKRFEAEDSDGFSQDSYTPRGASDEQYAPVPPPVAPDQRKPWFDCLACENRTRDHSQTPCCRTKVCGTCVRKRSGCPFCKQEWK